MRGLGHSGVRVAYIPIFSGPGGPASRIVLTRDARLPYQATRAINPAVEGYSLNAGLLGAGHITCTLRIGNASKTGRSEGPNTPCAADLQWSAKLGRWIKP